jgi:hypothetical protein
MRITTAFAPDAAASSVNLRQTASAHVTFVSQSLLHPQFPLISANVAHIIFSQGADALMLSGRKTLHAEAAAVFTKSRLFIFLSFLQAGTYRRPRS